MNLLKFRTNSYAISELETCGLKWILNHGMFRELSDQDANEIAPFDFQVFGRYVHTMHRLLLEKNYTDKSAAGMGIGLWSLYLDQIDMYERHPLGAAAYGTRIPSMMAEMNAINHDWRREGTIGWEVRGLTYIYTGRRIVGLGGRIDRLWMRDGHEVATDVKTSKQRKNDEELRRDPQFLIYSLIRKQKTGEYPEIEVYYPGGFAGGRRMPTEIVAFRVTDEDIAEFKARLDRVADKAELIMQMKRMKEFIQPEYEGCVFCPYAATGFCDDYSETDKTMKWRAPFRKAPKRKPIHRLNKKYLGLLKLRGWPRSPKYMIKVPSVKKLDVEPSLFMDI